MSKRLVTLMVILLVFLSSCGNYEREAIRLPGEFEPMKGVTVAWPLDLPVDLVRQMAENVEVHVIIDPNNSSDNERDVKNYLSKRGVATDKLNVHIHEMVSPYLRDYGAFYVFRGSEPAIVNFDNSIDGMKSMPGETFGSEFAREMGVPSITSTIHMDGGNLMSDGRGTAVSDILVTRTNNRDVKMVREEMRRVMGVNNYILTIDPQGGYIEHVDCWGKFLAPDKVLVAKVPKEHPNYQYYEQAADMFKSTLCCWGYPYKVYRVEEPVNEKNPSDSDAAPYTNSLILNKHVYLPLGKNDEYNRKAVAVYRKALPGYRIHGFKSDGSFLEWMNTDALHCRTHEIPDDDMVFVDHYNVFHGNLEAESSYRIEANITPYSGSKLKDAEVVYRINRGNWQRSCMNLDPGENVYVAELCGIKPGQRIEYYIEAEDKLGNKGLQPYTGADDPHSFTVKEE